MVITTKNEMLKAHWQQEHCSGNYSFSRPCHACGSNGQFIGEVIVLKTCGQCAYFGSIGCITSKHEQKFNNANTPACDEFKGK